MISRFKVLSVLIAAVVAFGAFAADGQTRRSGSTSKPKPTPTPRILTGAEIISQSTDGELLDPTVGITPEKTPEPVVTTDQNEATIKELKARIKKLEATRVNEYDEQQKRLMLNLDILTRAEQRSESLRKQVFDMIEKENSLISRMTDLESDLRPEAINRSAAFSGSMKPEEVREIRKKALEAERRNIQALLTEITNSRSALQATLQRADQLVERLRFRLEADIDILIGEDKKDQ
ncbi:MAG TPA: hypothetical protein PKA82_06720 [Pyrinomonadaceae bacterium]|nr:hypothetical protein [Pyrinomonadaceae bacterium]